MRTRLHMLANQVGVYPGLDTQYNGDGFSDMHFTAHVTTPSDFKHWVEQVKAMQSRLGLQNYKKLAQPSIKVAPAYYAYVRPHLFKRIMQQYTEPNSDLHA